MFLRVSMMKPKWQYDSNWIVILVIFFTGQAHLNLAVVYSSLGQQEKAKVELPKALDVFPKMTLSFIHREVDCSDETFVADYFDTLEKLGLPE